jgi:hypothetical protein
MPTLEQFLKTGRIGPIRLGMGPMEVKSLIGEPTDWSTSSTPLLFIYGPLQLTFWKKRSERELQLQEIALKFQPTLKGLPNAVMPSDWKIQRRATIKSFRSFLKKIDYSADPETNGSSSRQVVLPSGVRATFAEGMLQSLRAGLRQAPEKQNIALKMDGEPSAVQIRSMLDEAAQVAEAGSRRAALVIAWAGLEAVLRRLALQAGLQGRVGVQPIVLLRELLLAGGITPEDFEFINKLRLTRTSVAHGLAPTPIDRHTVPKAVRLARTLLEGAEKGMRTRSIAIHRLAQSTLVEK